jgi:hypothetical protein
MLPVAGKSPGREEMFTLVALLLVQERVVL